MPGRKKCVTDSLRRAARRRSRSRCAGPNARSPRAGNRGHGIRPASEPDGELVRIGPGTPCGEYLRRFWHPVAMSSEIAELPVALRILGEDLVVFRDGDGRVGLVHRHCPHRRASLEYGDCRQRGIRCCYHGWHFDVDGALLEAPGQSPEAQARLKERVRLGAYPAFEYQGLVFAYLGPPDETPEFPVYDTLELADMERVPTGRRSGATGYRSSTPFSIPSIPAFCTPASAASSSPPASARSAGSTSSSARRG